MLNQIKKAKQNKSEQGFTIIEVMIVLAIAGLILLIVFLAVPALQRNSRNTQRKNDVSAVLAAVNEYVSNNGGALPAAGNGTVAQDLIDAAHPGFYKSGPGNGNGQLQIVSGAQAALAGNQANDRVRVVEGVKCSTGGDTVGASPRSVAIQYEYETAGGFTATCQDS
jgi:prepilin-type N-terminal cleavage/methylation domain-containing protein